MTFPASVAARVDLFRENLEDYKSAAYNEANLRKEFVDPLFKALGWDMNNTQGHAEAYKDVIHEAVIKISGRTKAPDYAFRIGGIRKFFLEAKRPSINIKHDVEAAYQLRRYAWNAKLPLSILTDFEEFAVYDCRVKPNKNDKAGVARIDYFTYEEYEAKWGYLSSVFSREAIPKGSFDKYAEDSKRKKGTAEVDDDFLAEIEKWRESLAANIALRNKGVTVRQLNAAVQRTIDRIIFLRIAEDRGIEQYGKLENLKKGTKVYQRLGEMFREADGRYNSGLFHFKEGDGSDESLDNFTLDLKIDDSVIKDIIKNIYYPDSPYEFSVWGSDILGQVYEQFLGKVISINGRKAVIEDKPEVKKSGGVYYTPSYIVDYIVRKTIDPLLSGKTPGQLSGSEKRGKDSAPLRILDPACGSGSFLMQAYQRLLDWYREEYIREGAERHVRGKAPKLHRSPRGDWRLSIAEKRRILLTHIYGIDVDPQAVEVTKLSLLLKVLEGESGDDVARQMDLFHIRALPDLHSNIKSGNSLISSDLYEVGSYNLFTEEEVLNINAFDWHDEFDFLASGQDFQVVIGNPPYLPIYEMNKDALPYYANHYRTYQKRYDAYGLFIERVLTTAVSEGHRIGMILPSSLLNNSAFGKLRALLSSKAHLDTIVLLGGKVFRKVNKDTMILILSGEAMSKATVSFFDASPKGFGSPSRPPREIEQSAVQERGIDLQSAEGSGITAQIANPARCIELSAACVTFQGIVTGADDVFIGEDLEFSTAENKWLRPFVFGSDVREYEPVTLNNQIIYLTRNDTIDNKPGIERRLLPAKERLDKRRETQQGKIPWYALHWPRNKEIFEQGKLLIQGIRNLQLKKRIVATLDASGAYAGVNLTIVNLRQGANVSLEYVLGIVNSRVINYWFSHTFVDHRIKNLQIDMIPIPALSISDEDRKKIQQVEKLVKAIMNAKEMLARGGGASATTWRRQAVASRGRLEELIEDLYGLGDEARRVIRSDRCNAS